MKYLVKLSDKYLLSEKERFLYAKFELIEPNNITFNAGQYISLKVSEKGERRSYSIASTPDDTHGLNLLIEIIKNGRGSEYLSNLSLGGEAEIVGPLGQFVIADPTKLEGRKKLFVATGSGIVPIWSMINDLLINKHDLSPIRLHWGMKSEEDLFWIDELEQLTLNHPNFVYDVVLSRPSSEWTLCQGHVQDCLRRDFSQTDLSEWEGYVCGSQEIVLDICDLLEELKMKKELIYHEKFT